MTSAASFRAPPDGASLNHEGKQRHVGVELEFAACSAEDAAIIVRDLYGGEIEQVDPHLFNVGDTDLGDFRCELDLQYAHLTDDADADDASLLAAFADTIREVIGDLSAPVVPCEVVCPPVVFADLPRIEELRDALRRTGAEGTDASILYAFGAQLNPEIASGNVDYITSILKAYLVLSDWLRASTRIDLSRQILSFADPFPTEYAKLVLASDYWPDLDTLIDNHLAHNPTRNRDLDMLPLFSWLDDDRVRAATDDPRIQSRPTFHYRLPNAHVHDPTWRLAEEWNRWCRVEYLAADREKLEQAIAAWRESHADGPTPFWAEEAQQWLL